MADDRLRFILDFVAQTAGLKNAQELAEQLGTELTDAEDAGKQMAAALKAAADKADRELAETVALADKLGQALGPELTARVNVDEIAGKMRQVGMTTADVEANIDDFRSSLTKMANTADQAKARMGDLDDGVRRVGDSTDRSRSVMANFTGNAMQELPMLSGAFGPLNMAIGQFAEYGAEGNINLKGLAAQAGPMAGIGAAIWYANNQLEIMRKKDAFHADRVKAYSDLLDDAGDATENLANHLREVGKIEATTWGNAGNPFADATVDITEKLIQAGLTVDQYAQLVVGGTEAVRDFNLAQQEAGNQVDPELLRSIAKDAQDYAEAQDLAAISSRFFGAEYESMADKARGAARNQRDLNDALAGFNHQWDILNGKLDAADTFQAALDAIHDTEMAVTDQKRAVNEYLQQVLRLPASVGTKIDALIDEDNFAEVERRLAWLARTRDALLWQNVVDSQNGTHTAGGSRDARPDGVTVQLVVNDRAVQEVTAVQSAQQRGSR